MEIKHKGDIITRTMLALSHTEMSGGSYRFDADQERSFLKGYAKRTKMQNQRLTWVERTTQPHFHMFFDLDIKRYVGHEEMMAMGASIVRALGIQKRWLISSSGPTEKKTGIHLNCPHKVDREGAESLVAKVKEKCGFGDEIDCVPYKNGGLRMLWSKKANGAPAYVPLGEWDWEQDQWESIDHETCDREDILSTFSIRYIEGPPQKASYSKNFIAPRRRPVLSEGEGVDPCEDLALNLEEEIKFKWPQMGDIRVQELKKFDEANTILVKTDSKFCMNKGACHTGNHVFFIIKVDVGYWTIHQRCNSDHGSCAEYRGKKLTLGPTIVKQLKRSGIL